MKKRRFDCSGGTSCKSPPILSTAARAGLPVRPPLTTAITFLLATSPVYDFSRSSKLNLGPVSWQIDHLGIQDLDAKFFSTAVQKNGSSFMAS